MGGGWRRGYEFVVRGGFIVGVVIGELVEILNKIMNMVEKWM